MLKPESEYKGLLVHACLVGCLVCWEVASEHSVSEYPKAEVVSRMGLGFGLSV